MANGKPDHRVRPVNAKEMREQGRHPRYVAQAALREYDHFVGDRVALARVSTYFHSGMNGPSDEAAFKRANDRLEATARETTVLLRDSLMEFAQSLKV